MNYIYIRMGNKVSINNFHLATLNSFNEAWDYAQRLSKATKLKVFTQGGTWILD